MVDGSVKVVFDLNGTLVVGEYPSWESVLEKNLQLKRIEGESITLDDLREVAKGRVSFERLISKVFIAEDYSEVKKKAFQIYASKVKLREGAIETLNALYGRYRLILCSDTTGVAKEVVKRFGLSRYFEVELYSSEVGFLKSERGFWETLLSLFPASKPKEFFVVGDRLATDIYWPKKLGMHTIWIKGEISSPNDWVESPIELLGEKPDYRINRINEILDIQS